MLTEVTCQSSESSFDHTNDGLMLRARNRICMDKECTKLNLFLFYWQQSLKLYHLVILVYFFILLELYRNVIFHSLLFTAIGQLIQSNIFRLKCHKIAT